MDYLISVSFGELTLKGDNRKDFENRIIRKIKLKAAQFITNIAQPLVFGGLLMPGLRFPVP